jgi:galactokinase
MDQFASALGRPGHALFVDCRSLEVEHVPLPLDEHGAALVIVDSKVTRRLSDTAYNERRQECTEAARLLMVESLRAADEHSIEALPEPLMRRARHVVRENERVLGTVDALKRGDLERTGALMCESHESPRGDFEVSCEELDRLVDLARGVTGVLGARLTGAGFGGCTVNLVRAETIDEFRAGVVERYATETGLPAEMLVCSPSGGLEVTPV